MNNLAITHGILGQYADAKKLQIKVVDKRTRIFGEGHPDTIEAVALLTAIKSQADTNTSGTQLRKNYKNQWTGPVQSIKVFTEKCVCIFLSE